MAGSRQGKAHGKPPAACRMMRHRALSLCGTGIDEQGVRGRPPGRERQRDLAGDAAAASRQPSCPTVRWRRAGPVLTPCRPPAEWLRDSGFTGLHFISLSGGSTGRQLLPSSASHRRSRAPLNATLPASASALGCQGSIFSARCTRAAGSPARFRPVPCLSRRVKSASTSALPGNKAASLWQTRPSRLRTAPEPRGALSICHPSALPGRSSASRPATTMRRICRLTPHAHRGTGRGFRHLHHLQRASGWPNIR